MGCQTQPKETDFDANWEFLAIPGEPTKACLKQDDVIRLKWILNSCEPEEEK